MTGSKFSVLTLTVLLGLATPYNSAFAKDEDCVSKETRSGDQEKNPEEWGNFLSGTNRYDARLLNTMMSAMTHSCFVTQKESKTVMALLKKSGWKAVGSNGKPTRKVSKGIIEPGAGRAYVAYHDDLHTAVVVFRGTGVKGIGKGYKLKLLKNALTDGNLIRKKIRWLPKKASKKWKGLTKSRHKTWSKLKVHNGFNKEYDRFDEAVAKRVSGVLKSKTQQGKKPKVYCIGFSLGAALATHCGAHLKLRFGIDPHVLVGASPRVGSDKFQKAYDSLVKNSHRIMLEKDPVAQVPGNLLKNRFEHVGHRLLPLYYGDKLGQRLSSKKLKSTTHSLSTARALSFIGKFVKYHHYLKYKDALRAHRSRCKEKCNDGVLKKLADDERASSSERKEKRKARRDDRKEKRSTRKENRKSKAECKKACKKKKSRKDRRTCTRACK